MTNTKKPTVTQVDALRTIASSGYPWRVRATTLAALVDREWAVTNPARGPRIQGRPYLAAWQLTAEGYALFRESDQGFARRVMASSEHNAHSVNGQRYATTGMEGVQFDRWTESLVQV